MAYGKRLSLAQSRLSLKADLYWSRPNRADASQSKLQSVSQVKITSGEDREGNNKSPGFRAGVVRSGPVQGLSGPVQDQGVQRESSQVQAKDGNPDEE